MSLKKKYKAILLMCTLGFLISCDRDFKEIQKSSKVAFIPTSEVENFVMRYTDSARIKSILKSSLMYDYGWLEFTFTELPQVVDITVFDQKLQRSYIVADYAITFAKSDIIDLQGNVKVTSNNGDVLETEQLYYDRSREWFFTEKDCKLTNKKGEYYFKGFDSKSDLTKVEMREFRGEGIFSE